MSRMKTTMVPAQVCEDQWRYESKRSDLAGLFVLTESGALARLNDQCIPIPEPGLTADLSEGIDDVLERYRTGRVEKLCLGLILDSGRTQSTMILSDEFSEESSGTHRTGTEPLDGHRNGSGTVVRLLARLLGRKQASEPFFPYLCPVLVATRSDHDTLDERYGVKRTESGDRFEVLDLAVPFRDTHRPPEGLFGIRSALRRLIDQLDMQGGGDVSQGRWMEEYPREDGVVISALPDRCPDDTFFNEGDSVSGWLLEWFSPFNELTETQRDIVAGYETIRKAGAGTRLVERGSTNDICIYLVEGVLELTTEEGDTIRVVGGTRRSRLPISVLSPHVYDVTAVTDVSIIAFSQRLVRKINEITRTYTGVNRARVPDASTVAISNGVQSVYFNCADVSAGPREGC